MIKVGILGATGYTAYELLKILLRHPEVEIAYLASRQEDRPPIASIHPQLAGRLDLPVENMATFSELASADCVFSCLPHAASAVAIAPLLERTAVIDLSADYRLDDASVYEEWYHCSHPDPDRLGTVVYGLPELSREQIRKSKLVANPGCYTSTSILGLAPLLDAGLIDPLDIVIDAKSGVSGAGRSPKLQTLFAECNESLTAYAVGRHRHTPEIEQVLSQVSGSAVRVLFTPHLIPMDRGILCTIYARGAADVAAERLSEESLKATIDRFYDDSPFVRLVDHLPATKFVAGTNYCDISVRCVRDRILIFSATDNLIKGAAGVAVQNLNLMFGYDESTALIV